MTAESLDRGSLSNEPDPSLHELLRDAGSHPVQDVRELAVDGFFESDEDLEDFLRFYHDQRQASIG